MGTVALLPEEIQSMAEGIHILIQSVYDDSVLKDMFSDGHETKVKENPLNENFAKAEFQALWKQINHKYAYTVEFDSNVQFAPHGGHWCVCQRPPGGAQRPPSLRYFDRLNNNNVMLRCPLHNSVG